MIINLRRPRFGGVLGKYFLLLAFILMLAGFFYWKAGYGHIGGIKPMPDSTAGFIAFIRDVDGSSDLYLADSSGKDLRKRTSDGASKRGPAWSPDGKQICFSGEPRTPGPEGRTFQLFLIGGGDARVLTYGSVSKSKPHWAPNGKLIGFLSGGAIKVIEPNGIGLRQIYPPPHAGSGSEEGSEDEHDHGEEPDRGGRKPPIDSFRWSPVGSALAAIQLFEGEYAFAIGEQHWWEKGDRQLNESETGGSQAVVDPEALILMPRFDSGKVERRHGTTGEKVSYGWYPDGNKIAVAVATRQGRYGIASYRLDDEVAQPEIHFAGEGYTVGAENPTVSPDGKKLAFELWRMNSAEDRQLLGIAVISAEGEAYRVLDVKSIARIPLIVKEGSRPQWSPDGARLLFYRMGKGGRDVWVAGADGANQVNLTNGTGDNFDAVWSPAR